MSHLRIAIPLAATAAVAPFALDTYLPSFPLMAETFGVTAHEVSLSVSVYILMLAVGQLVGGPMADRVGRSRVMLAGLVLFVLSSLAITQVQQLGVLNALRAVQAFGGGFLMVCVPAMVRDRVHGSEAAKMFSLIGLMMVAAPAIAPSIGAFLLRWGWPAIFYFLAAYGLLVIIVLRVTLFREGFLARAAHDSSAPNAAQLSAMMRYATVLKTSGAVRYVFLQGFLFTVMILFVTHASFIYQTHFNVTNATFGLLFGANIVMMWIAMMANRILLGYFPSKVLLKCAICLQMLAVSALVLSATLDLSIFFYAPALIMTVGMIGVTSPNCHACYMDYFAANGATAAAVMGAMQFGLSGCLSALSTLLPESLLSITIMQLACSLVAVGLIMWPKAAPQRAA